MEEEKLESSVKGSQEKELKDLERLTEKFGKNSGLVDIQGDQVYGYINNKRTYLGALGEWSRYKNLKLKYKKTTRKYDVQKCKEDEEHENNIKAYKCFLESCKSRNPRNP